MFMNCVNKKKLEPDETYVFLNRVNPRLGKLSNPHEFPIPLKNHLKQLQHKLMLKYFPRHMTCFLQKIKNRLGVKWNVNHSSK